MGCLEPADDGDVRQHGKLLDAMMYEECTHQYYMLYYQNHVKQNIQKVAQQEPNAL